MKFTDPIFEIPIYRCSPTEHDREVDHEFNKLLDNMKIFGDDRKKWRNKLERQYENAFWRRWRYNQIIGWLNLYASSFEILSDLFWVDAKRIVQKHIKKNFVWKGHKAICVPVDSHMTDKDIFEEIKTALMLLKHEKPYKNRYINIEKFCNIGTYVNWKKLIADIK